METIYKYPLHSTVENELEIPADAEILSCGSTKDGIFVWVKLDPTMPTQKRIIETVGAGWRVPSNSRFISTVIVGSKVWHYFEHL